MIERKVLMVVDAQNDFCEGGALGSNGASVVCADIAQHLWGHAREYQQIIFSKDWHITPGEHFQQWPQHCVAGTKGADFFWRIQEWYDEHFFWRIQEWSDEHKLDSPIELEDGSPPFAARIHTVYKGQNDHGYSAWTGENREFYYQSVDQIVRQAITGRVTTKDEPVHLTIDVCGLVLEHCVKATLLDALRLQMTGKDKLTVRLLEDLTVPNNPKDGLRATEELVTAGVQIG